MQKEKELQINLPYRIMAIPAGWLVQRKLYVGYETLAYCKTLQEATDYLFAWKEINL